MNNNDGGVIFYGGVELSDNARVALNMNPSFMRYERIDDLSEVEIEKGCTKARYHFMFERNNSNVAERVDVENKNNGNEGDNSVLDLENKSADYAKVRATDLPTVQRHNQQP